MIDFPETHRCIGTEARTCDLHGTYSAQQLELIRKPKGYPRAGPAGLHSFLAPFWTKCPQCNDAYQREADARDAEIKGGMSAKDAMRAARLRDSGIPDRYVGCTVWNWRHTFDQQRRVADQIRGYVNQFDVAMQQGRSVLLYGASGTGKTHLAIGVLRHVTDAGGTGRYTTAMDMVGTIRATYGSKASETEQAVMARLCSVDVLVIDEIGRQTDTTYEREQLWRIIDRRYADLRPSVLVSNLGKEALIGFLGQPMIDRLRESGGVVCVFDWPSQRSPKPRASEDGEGGES